jgi:hypothetical protein
VSDDPKNEGEALHIVSPSTIPLTLGEEMAVLVLPRSLYQTWQDAHHRESAGLTPKHFNEEDRHRRGGHAWDAGRVADRPRTHRSQLLHYFIRKA